MEVEKKFKKNILDFSAGVGSITSTRSGKRTLKRKFSVSEIPEKINKLNVWCLNIYGRKSQYPHSFLMTSQVMREKDIVTLDHIVFLLAFDKQTKPK